MEDPIFVILSAILMLLGAVGLVAPILPGLPLSWAGLLLIKFAPSLKDNISWTTIIILGIVAFGITLLDNVLPVWGTKRMGGNKTVVWGATIGLLVGFFMGPLGIIFGPFVGAFAGSILSGSSLRPATKQATGAFLGFLVGMVLKFITLGFILFFYIRAMV